MKAGCAEFQDNPYTANMLTAVLSSVSVRLTDDTFDFLKGTQTNVSSTRIPLSSSQKVIDDSNSLDSVHLERFHAGKCCS